MIFIGLLYIIVGVVFIKLYKDMEKTWCLLVLPLLALSFLGTTPFYENLPFNGKMFLLGSSILLGLYILYQIPKGLGEAKREYRRTRRMERRKKEFKKESDGNAEDGKRKYIRKPSFTIVSAKKNPPRKL